MKVAVIVLAVVAVVAAGLAGFAIWKMEASVGVPEVVGQKQAAAQDSLGAAGLVSVVQDTYADNVAEGTVAKQQPAAGAKIAKGSTVTVWVSRGAEKVAVPDLGGQTTAQAEAALTAAGLNSAPVAGDSTSVAEGQIYNQAPTAGTQVPRGSVITVYYNATSPTVAVPSLMGLTEAQAANQLQKAGLYLGAVGTQTSPTATQGTVISQSIPATEQVARSSKVNIVLAGGPPPVVVPDVLNMPYKEAQSQLSAQGFQVVTSWSPGTGMSPGAVIKVVPSVGSPVPSGSIVHIYVEEGSLPQ